MMMTNEQIRIEANQLKIAAALFLATITPSFAQPASVAQTLPAELVLKVTPSELDVISEGLQTQPFGKVVPLMNKLRQQVIDQQPKPVEAPATAPK